MNKADDLIARLGLAPLGFEGGYFRENTRSLRTFEGPGGAARALHTAIYYLLAPDSRSLLHRLRSDEVYHFYRGDPVDLHLLHPDGSAQVITLGSRLEAGQVPQFCVPAGVWQGGELRPGGRYALMGTTMAPGFHPADFELGRASALEPLYPDAAAVIRRLTPTRVERGGLELRAATPDLLYAERTDPTSFATGLAASIPSAWPPPAWTDAAQAQTLDALKAEVAARDWRAWYVIDRGREALVGLGGFAGPPSQDGAVTLLRLSFCAPAASSVRATALEGFVEFAGRDPAVRRVVARADGPDDRVALEAAGFRLAPDGAWETRISRA